MNSRLFDATVSHARRSPREHEFRYRVPVFIFDLAELESLMAAGDYIETWKFIERNIFSIK